MSKVVAWRRVYEDVTALLSKYPENSYEYEAIQYLLDTAIADEIEFHKQEEYSQEEE